MGRSVAECRVADSRKILVRGYLLIYLVGDIFLLWFYGAGKLNTVYGFLKALIKKRADYLVTVFFSSDGAKCVGVTIGVGK